MKYEYLTTLSSQDTKKKIIKDFQKLILQIDDDVYPDEIENQLFEIIKRIRKLYSVDRSI